MFCGSLNLYYVMNKVLSELVACSFCNTFQSFITKKCLLGVSRASHNPAFLCFPMSTSFSPKLPEQVRAVLLFTFPLAPPLCSATSWSPWPVRGEQGLSSHRNSIPRFGVQNSLKSSSRVKFLRLRTGSQLEDSVTDWDKVLFTESFNSPLPSPPTRLWKV